MLEIVKKRITLTKGDDGSIWLRPKYKDQSVYEVQEGDRAYFRIKTTTDTLELECNVNVDANKIVVSFVPDDTKDMLPGIYRYEAELVTSWGMHYTFLADQTFILGKELEKRVSNGYSTIGNYGNNLPSIDGELDDPVVDGDLQPTNPSLDYNELNHLPKINHNTLKGDMSNEDLGIPTALADMTDDEEHRVVTDEQISDWNKKVEDDNYVHTDNNFDDTYKSAIDNLGTAATKNVPESGNASSSEVVLGSDTRLTDARPASDVSDWAKQPTKPSYNASEISGLGTAAVKDFTTSVIEDSADLVTSGAVKSAIDSAVSSLYKPAGNKTCAELVSALLIQANLGNTYNMSDSGVTTADFVEGAGHPINVGDNVAIVEVSGAYKFDILSGMVDLSNYVQKSATSGLIKNDGSIDTTAYAKQSEMSVTDGTGVDADKTTIQLKNGTSATVLKTHQDISGKANKSEMSITDGTGADADKVTIQLKDGASTKVLKTHQDISGKVDKEAGKGLSTNDYDNTAKGIVDGVTSALNDKVDKVQGKGLSTNDYDNTAKGIVDGVTSALADKVDKVNGKGLSTEDYTTAEKSKLGDISDNAKKVASSSTNGHIEIDDVDTTVYDDTAVQNAIDNIEDELSTDYATIEGNPINFSTLTSQNAESTIIDLEPIQDLHGYDKPWVGGAGKNLLIPDCSPFSHNSVTFTPNPDGSVTIVSNGASTYNTNFHYRPDNADSLLKAGNYKLSIKGLVQGVVQFVVGGLNSTIQGTTIQTENDYSFTINNDNDTLGYCIVQVPNNVTINTTVYPMIRLATETDKTWTPYKNICPISGRTEVNLDGCGKNLFDEIENGGFDSDGLNTSASIRVRSKNYISVVSGQSYAISALPTTSGKLVQVSISYYTKDDYVTPRENFTDWDNVPNKVITIPEGIKFIRLLLRYADNSNVTVDSFEEIQIEKNNQSTQYTSYQSSNDLTISLGQTVYGGQIDVEKGVLTVNKVKQTITKDTPVTLNTNSGYQFTYENLAGNANRNIITDRYANSIETVTWDTLPNKMIMVHPSLYNIFRIRNDDYQNTTDWTNHLENNPVDIVYELATPTTIQLTPNAVNLLKGNNYITTDGDNITLVYREGEVATLGDVKEQVAQSQIIVDSVTFKKYRLVIASGVLDIEEIT